MVADVTIVMLKWLREIEHTVHKCNAIYTLFGGDLKTEISRNTPTLLA